MPTTTVVVIGAGQAGLAMSRCLTDRSIDHVVLDRGRVAQSWRSERWDSLRLLTPNWLSRLPGFQYDGPDPDAHGSLVGCSPQSGVGYRKWFHVSCVYASAFFGLAVLEELKLGQSEAI